MGSTVSRDAESDNLKTKVITRFQLRVLFRKEVKNFLSNIELITISRFLFGDIKGLNEVIKYCDLLKLLNLSFPTEDKRKVILYKFLKALSNWPLLSERVEYTEDSAFTLNEVLVLLFILNKNGFEKLGFNYYDYYVKLIFLIFSLEDADTKEHVDGDNNVDLIYSDDKIKWELLPIVQSFDEIENEGIQKSQLKDLLEILLPLSIVGLTPDAINLNYGGPVKSLTLTLFLSCSNERLPYSIFIANCRSFAPCLFKSLNKLLEGVIVGRNEKESDNDDGKMVGEKKVEKSKKSVGPSCKMLDFPMISQISTIVDLGSLNLDVNAKPLYQGSKDGFSINSIQSHTIGYNATTFLLVSGKTVEPNQHLKHAFFRKFPKFHPVMESGQRNVGARQRFQIAVLISTPWRVTNTKNFGSKEFEIIQLSPYQVVLDASRAVKDQYAYFSNIGVGLGFGSKPPTKAKDVRSGSVSFDTGGVSLTIDNALEMGNLRIEDLSTKSSVYGVDSVGTDVSDQLYGDTWFKIHDIEIYGLGNLQSLEDQKRSLEWEEREAERRRGLGDSGYQEGRALLELAGIIGTNGGGGSM